MNESRVYDLPTRVFHWLFAFLFVVAFAIGNSVDDDSSLFSYHMLAGIVLFLLVIFRLVWGIIGTKYARFSGFSLNPRELLEYFKGVLTGMSRTWIGHNPASSWAAIMMMLFALGLGVTGYLMSNGEGGHDLKEVHELLANGFLIVVLLHIAGVVLHSLRHRDGIWKSMFGGQKSPALEQIPPVPTYATLGILLLVATIGFSG
ncbi:MAG: cytochrome b/b6 domain-containing protein, partial [Bdellovibrionales bacterium]|nr:cytochrome b/b6 domain-containing protein [Bdellovibrionales bacterium]